MADPVPIDRQPSTWLVLDACVLMSSILRPVLLDLAGDGWFRPIWSERIGLEWRRNAARIWGTPIAELEEEWRAMQARYPEADAGDVAAFEAVQRYSDPKDRHVVAAGLAARARAAVQERPVLRVLTWNLKDFNRGELKRQDMAAWDPDRQLAEWLEREPARMALLLATASRHALARGRDEPLTETMRRERLFRTGRLLDRIGEEES